MKVKGFLAGKEGFPKAVDKAAEVKTRLVLAGGLEPGGLVFSESGLGGGLASLGF